MAGYKADNYWSCFQRQIQVNKDLGADKASFPFVLGLIPPTDANPYLTPRPKGKAKVLLAPKLSKSLDQFLQSNNTDSFLLSDKTKLLYYVKNLIGVYCLCIPSSVAPDILAIAHGEIYLGFSYCHKIITRFEFIWELTKLFRTFVCHYPQCLAFQIRQHTLYGSLQPIKSPSVLFFTLTLDFILVFPVSADGFNALMLVTCKFPKGIIFIKEIDTWSAK